MALKMGKKKIVKPKIVKQAKTRLVVKAKIAKTNTEFLLPAGNYVEAVGRRKVATARVRIFNKPGKFYVNKQLAEIYFSQVINAKKRYNKPLSLVDMVGQLTISAQVNGSGINAQLLAVIHGLARALVKFNPELRPLLKQAGLLTRDDRMKETRKIGMGGKARRRRQSPRR